MDDGDIQLILPLVEEVAYPINSTIFSQDQYADYFYVLRQGEVEIRYKPYDGPFLRVTTVYAGEVFGWSSVLQHECYTSAAISVMDCSMYRIAGAALTRLCGEHPETGLLMLERLSLVISSRLTATQSEVTRMLQNGRQGDAGENGRENGDE